MTQHRRWHRWRSATVGAALAFGAACGTGAGQPDASPDAWVPARYEGYVAVTPISLHVILWPGDGACECPRTAPVFGDCLPTDDVGECDPRCIVCDTVMTITVDDAEIASAQWNGVSLFHRADAGATISVRFSGCLGDVEATILVPEPQPNVVEPPEPLPDDRTRVQWSPTGTDEAYIDVGAPGGGMICRVPDTGIYDVSLPFRDAEFVRVDRRTQVGPLVQDNAYLDLFQAQSGFWQEEGTFAVRPMPHPALFE